MWARPSTMKHLAKYLFLVACTGAVCFSLVLLLIADAKCQRAMLLFKVSRVKIGNDLGSVKRTFLPFHFDQSTFVVEGSQYGLRVYEAHSNSFCSLVEPIAIVYCKFDQKGKLSTITIKEARGMEERYIN